MLEGCSCALVRFSFRPGNMQSHRFPCRLQNTLYLSFPASILKFIALLPSEEAPNHCQFLTSSVAAMKFSEQENRRVML